MVVQGGFSLQLIDAETQQPLNEYRGPSGSVYYAEAKPGGEYFLRFQVLQDDIMNKEGNGTADNKNSKHETDSETMMYFRPAVDGKDLGFYTNLTKSHGARDVGLWTYVNGIGTNQALKFETAAAATANEEEATITSPHSAVVAAGTASSSSATAESQEESAVSAAKTNAKGAPRLHMGNVQVQISKGVFTGYQKRVYSGVQALTTQETVVVETAAPISASSSLQEEEDDQEANASSVSGISAGSNNNKATEGPMVMDAVPVLRSREGAAKFQQKFSEECPTYQPGEMLETITIHYGSTAALVQAGIMVPISGMVPQYVAAPHPSTPAVQTTVATAAVTVVPPNASNIAAPASPPQEKVVVPNPLLDVSSSTRPSGVKRVHSATTVATEGDNKKGAGEVQPPATKKHCHSVPAKEPALVEAPSAGVISK